MCTIFRAFARQRSLCSSRFSWSPQRFCGTKPVAARHRPVFIRLHCRFARCAAYQMVAFCRSFMRQASRCYRQRSCGKTCACAPASSSICATKNLVRALCRRFFPFGICYARYISAARFFGFTHRPKTRQCAMDRHCAICQTSWKNLPHRQDGTSRGHFVGTAEHHPLFVWCRCLRACHHRALVQAIRPHLRRRWRPTNSTRIGVDGTFRRDAHHGFGQHAHGIVGRHTRRFGMGCHASVCRFSRLRAARGRLHSTQHAVSSLFCLW